MLMSTCRMLRAAFSSRWTAAPPPKEYGRAPTYICLRYTRIFDWLPKALATFCKDICRLKYTSAHNLTKEPPSPPQWPAWISGLFEKLDFFTEYFGTSRCSRMGSYGSLLHGGRIDRGRFQSPSPSPFAVVSQPHHTHAPRTDFKEAMDGDVSIAHEHHHLYADMVMEDVEGSILLRRWRGTMRRIASAVRIRHRKKILAIRKIQAAFLRAYYDSTFAICKRRIERWTYDAE
jgi:hypothetical protein